MSPEQAQGRPVDARSDVFSFGVLLYELLTGCRPFEGQSKLEILAAILHEPPKPLGETTATELPPELERIVLRCLRKEPDRRFQNVADLRIALEDLKEDFSTCRPRATPATLPTHHRMHWAIGIVSALVAVCLILVFLIMRNGPPAQHALKQITYEAGIARDPALSPDGKLLAYASDRGGGNELQIWIRQMGGSEPVRLTSSAGSKSNPQFSSDGTKVYYLSQGDLFEVPSLGGTSRKVFEGLGPFVVSNLDDIAFYQPGNGNYPGPIKILSSGGGNVEQWHAECRSLGPPAWSPEGDRLAFVGMCGSLENLGIMIGPRRDGTIRKVLPLPLEQLVSRIVWFRLRKGSEGLLFSWRLGDSTNLFVVTLDGGQRQITSGTGLETGAAVSLDGDLLFTRAESSGAVWSIPLNRGARPTREIAPATYFTASVDGTKLVYGRMLGAARGELVLRDRTTGGESVLVAQDVQMFGAGSFWPQISPDGKWIIYRVFSKTPGIYLISTDGGAPRLLLSAMSKDFSLASDWRPNGAQVIGECGISANGICELDPVTGNSRRLLSDPKGGELLYPSFSWDGKWVAFMRRREGRTAIFATPVQSDGSLEGEPQWIRISSEDGNASRPRFSPDGSKIYYLVKRGAEEGLICQKLDPATKKPSGSVVELATIPFSGIGTGLLTVSRGHVFFNTTELRSNVWMTRIK
jgi:Tol biopolymer transport system component